MLDDSRQIFYDVDYENRLLRNTKTWAGLEMHKVVDPAIVFPPTQKRMLQQAKFATGFLVSIESRDLDTFTARKIGSVNVSPCKEESMNWDALKSLKGEELPTEMQHGILRRVWNRRPQTSNANMNYLTPASVMDGMVRPWHNDGAQLSYELDEMFAGGLPISNDQSWQLSAAD